MPNLHLQEARDAVLRAALAHVDHREPLLLLEAPPGSGKTHVLVRLAILARHRQERVAVVTQTNAQADDVARRLATEFPSVGVHRFLASTADDVELGASVTCIRREKDLPTGPSIVVATGAKWSTLRALGDFDLALVDEAWQMKWADFTLLGRVAARFVLIGDPGQIAPTVTIRTERWETARRPPHRAAPEVIRHDDTLPFAVHQLPVSTRLPHDTVELVRAFYDFEFASWSASGERRLLPGRATRRSPYDRAIDRLRDATVACLTLRTPDEGPPAEEDLELTSAVAALMRRLLERKTRFVTEDGEDDLRAEHVGITATHRVMNARITEALGDLAEHVRVDTPERWQGLERPVMIAVHPLSSVTDPSPFDLDTGRLCVMTSRHRVGLILVTRDHVGRTLDEHLPSAEQPVSQPDLVGRGHERHRAAWKWLMDNERVIALGGSK